MQNALYVAIENKHASNKAYGTLTVVDYQTIPTEIPCIMSTVHDKYCGDDIIV